MEEVIWTIEQENILIDWADKAMCYRWLHSKSHAKYNFLNACFTIPVIIMSTIAGTANFAQERFSDEYKSTVVMIIGSINILAGIITTIQQFLKIGELNEAHRVSSISWGKFSRNVKLELSRHPNQRSSPVGFIKICKEEFDRLMETSPNINEEIITKFKKRFNDEQIKSCCISSSNQINELENVTDKSKFSSLSKPEICDQMESIASSVYGRSKTKEIVNDMNIKVTDDNSERLYSAKKTHVENIVHSLFIAKSRQPTEDEIINNINDTIVDTETAKKIIQNYDFEKKNNDILKNDDFTV